MPRGRAKTPDPSHPFPKGHRCSTLSVFSLRALRSCHRSVVNPFRMEGGNSDGDRTLIFVPRCAGPPPVTSVLDESTTNGIVVDVIDHPQQGFSAGDIAVVAATRLPEETLNFGSTGTRDSRQPVWSVGSEVLNCPLPHWPLDRLADYGDIIRDVMRLDDDVRMVGHEDVRPQIEMPGATAL